MNGADERPTAVVAALAEELSAFGPRLRLVERATRDGYRVSQGRLGEAPVVLAALGVGAGRARAGLETLLGRYSVRRVLIVGVAGGLSPELAQGDLVVAREVRNGSGTVPKPDPDWTAAALAATGTNGGLVWSSPTLLVTAADKRRAFERLGSVSGPVAVDLESAALGRCAARHGLPYLVARSVSDTAAETLPLDFERYRGEDGDLRRGAIALAALVRPRRIGRLLELSRRVRRASTRLADVAEKVLA